jgi:hypothetical protein
LKPANISGIKRVNISKTKLMSLQHTGKNKDIRALYIGINEFKSGYQPTDYWVKNENCNLLPDSHVLNKWKNYLPHLLDVHIVHDDRQIEILTAQLLVRSPGCLAF